MMNTVIYESQQSGRKTSFSKFADFSLTINNKIYYVLKKRWPVWLNIHDVKFKFRWKKTLFYISPGINICYYKK